MKIQKLSHLMNRYLPSLGLALLIAIPIYTPAHASTRTGHKWGAGGQDYGCQPGHRGAKPCPGGKGVRHQKLQGVIPPVPRAR